jgi:uncharacterized protein YdeI (YjbR/CyaY-like superfamily)
MTLPDDLPIKRFRNAAAFDKWLAAHASAPGAWLRIAKKGAAQTTVTYAEAVQVALCHGWIDGLKRSDDASFFLQRFTPRKPKSLWSKINVAHAERLVAEGSMRAGGQREIDAAKADGRWQAAYDAPSSMQVPEELAAALAKNRKAKAFFDKLDKVNRYSFCWRVQTATKAETRKARVEKFVAMLARGEKIHG